MSTQSKTPQIQRILAIAAVALLAMAAGYWFASLLYHRQADLSGLHATHFSTPRPVQAFELIDHHGTAFRNSELEGHWSFIFFGYTHCPDVCPTTLSVLNSVAGRLEEISEPARFIFVSIDPERDTPERLGQYVSYFNGEFIGVTGTPDEISKLTRQLGVMYMKVAGEDSPEAGYLLDHTASVLLFDPDGRFHAVFSPPLKVADIVDDFTALSHAYR